MKKRTTYESYDQFTGEPRILDMSKRASAAKEVAMLPDMLDFFNSIKIDTENKSYLLINVMGASEYYGQNLNGDIFNEEDLIKYYKTFEQGHVFSNHKNDDPSQAFGRIIFASYNLVMHRVELLIEIYKDDPRAQKVLHQIEAGRLPRVSMGCFKKGSLVTMEDGTKKAIELVEVGDRVITHKGDSKAVTETHRRPYSGPIYCIKTEAHEIIECTEDHLFWGVSSEQTKPKGRWLEEMVGAPDWVHAKCLAEDSILIEPIMSDVVTPDYVTRSFSRLLGYYLAEGHVLRNKKKEIFGIEFSTHMDDTIHSEIEQLCIDFGTRNAPSTSPRAHSAVARSVIVCDKKLALLCYEHGGSYARHKRLSKESMRWHPDLQREILGAYINGDGTGHSKGSIGISTASTDLAWQWMMILPRLGITASVCNLEHKAGSGFSRYNTYEWVIHIGKQWAQGLQDVTSKVVKAPVKLRKNSRHIYMDMVATPVRHIKVEHADTVVYNLEVEDDSSYLISGLAVHNCKVSFDVCEICGNKARTRDEYCVHCRDGRLGKLNPDGTRNSVRNPHPRFFDISFVIKEADNSSGFLAKVASDKNATEDKESSIDKEIPAGEVVENVDDAISGKKELVLNDASKIDNADECFPEELLDLMGGFSMPDICSTMGALRMKLKPEEFTYLALKPSLGRGNASILLGQRKSIGPIVVVKKSGLNLVNYQTHYNDKLAALLMPHMMDRSFYSGYYEDRPKAKTATQHGGIQNQGLMEMYGSYVHELQHEHPTSMANLFTVNPGLKIASTCPLEDWVFSQGPGLQYKTASDENGMQDISKSQRRLLGAYANEVK